MPYACENEPSGSFDSRRMHLFQAGACLTKQGEIRVNKFSGTNLFRILAYYSMYFDFLGAGEILS